MPGPNQHVLHREDGLAVPSEGAQRDTTQAEAIDIAREIARNQRSQLFMHNRQGRIRSRDSYGGDPFPPCG